MTGKLLFAVFIAAFLPQGNGAIDGDIAEICQSYLKLVEAFMDQGLTYVDTMNETFYKDYYDAAAELKNGEYLITEDQVKILVNLDTNEKSAEISARNLLHYLKNTTEHFLGSLQLEMTTVAQNLEDDIKNQVKKAGGNMEKLKVCSQKYEKLLSMTIKWLLAGQIGCFMDRLLEGVRIIEKIISITEDIKISLTTITGNTDPTEYKSNDEMIAHIKECSEGFPISEASTFIDSQTDHEIKIGYCIADKMSEYHWIASPTVQKIVDCTKGM